MKILKDHVYNILDFHQPFTPGGGRGGFRKNFNTINHIPALNEIIEKAREFDMESWLLFIDFNKVFVNIIRNRIWQALAE